MTLTVPVLTRPSKENPLALLPNGNSLKAGNSNGTVGVDFGNGGQFTIELSDLDYSKGWWQGPEGEKTVTAKVTLNSAPAPVPAPAAAWLLGS